MKKEYKRPRIASVLLNTEVLYTGSSVEITGGGPTLDAPDAKGASEFHNEDEFWGYTTKKPWE